MEETNNGESEGVSRRGDIEREREKETEVQDTIGVMRCGDTGGDRWKIRITESQRG